MNFKKTLSVILYVLYFLMWAIALGLASLLFIPSLYNTGLLLGTFWGMFTLGITIIVLLILSGIYFLKKERRTAIKKIMLTCLIPLVPAIIVTGIYFFPKRLEKNEQTTELRYIRWACDCANWATPADIDKYHDKGRLEDHCVYIEPANDKLKLAGDIEYNNTAIRFTGKFYIKKGFPKGYRSIETPQPARVFRYTKYEIVKPAGQKKE